MRLHTYHLIAVSPYVDVDGALKAGKRDFFVMCESFDRAHSLVRDEECVQYAHLLLACRHVDPVVLRPGDVASLNESVKFDEFSEWLGVQHNFRVLHESLETLQEWRDSATAYEWAV